jgi:hypothetical protein
VPLFYPDLHDSEKDLGPPDIAFALKREQVVLAVNFSKPVDYDDVSLFL